MAFPTTDPNGSEPRTTGADGCLTVGTENRPNGPLASSLRQTAGRQGDSRSGAGVRISFPASFNRIERGGGELGNSGSFRWLTWMDTDTASQQAKGRFLRGCLWNGSGLLLLCQ